MTRALAFLKAFFAFLVLLAVGSGQAMAAQGEGLQRPMESVEVEMDRAISMDDLTATAKELSRLRQERLAACPQIATDWFHPCTWKAPVPAVFAKTAPHIEGDDINNVYSPPYQPYNLSFIQDRLTLAVLAPLHQVKGGSDVFKLWAQYANTGQLLKCRNAGALPDDPAEVFPPGFASTLHPQPIQLAAMKSSLQSPSPKEALACLAVVRSIEHSGLAFLSICQAIVIDGVKGAPTGCVPIAAWSAGDKWLLAEAGFYSVSLANNGMPDFSFNLFYSRGDSILSLRNSRMLTSQDVLKAAERAISSPPLLLRTFLTSRLLGTAPRRTSLVIPGGFNEEVTVRIDVDSIERDGGAGKLKTTDYTLEVSTAILVNLQKNSSDISWHRPLPEQLEAWTDAIRERLAEEVGRLCRRPVRRDDFSVFCN